MGLNTTSVAVLNERCVAAFPDSKTRRTAWRGLIHIVNVLQRSELKGELWVGGDFVTSMMDPAGSELLLRVNSSLVERATRRQREGIALMTDDLRTTHACDSYVLVEYPPRHPQRAQGEYWRNFWTRQLGAGTEGQTAGIAVIEIGGGLHG